MNGTHFFEMFRFLTGESPVEVTGWLTRDRLPNPRGQEFEDRGGSVRVTTEGGKRLYVELGTDQGHGLTIIIYGRNGYIVLDYFKGLMRSSVRQTEHRGLPTTRYLMPSNETEEAFAPASAVEPSRLALKSLLEQTDAPTGEQGRQALEVLVGAFISDENGNIPIPLDKTGLPRNRTFPWA